MADQSWLSSRQHSSPAPPRNALESSRPPTALLREFSSFSRKSLGLVMRNRKKKEKYKKLTNRKPLE
jgi:hypothetical protein